jgi:2,7-dihydroxy-5-methyl-1-naphthoate 7-O-methyltransferase
MLIAVLRARPGLRGSLVERAATAEVARHRLAAAGLSSRATAIAGDFFQPLPAAELYLLVNVLHD